MHPPFRAATVSVDYAHLLSLTLPYNRHHFGEWLIVTSSEDILTQSLANKYDCDLFITDSFYAQGADFNKWIALEEGLDHFGRTGWMVMLDADTFWPRRLPEFQLEKDVLYTPVRRMCPELEYVPLEEEWTNFRLHPNQTDWAGYTQVFHCTDSHLPQPPWHQIFWRHAGGADTFFQELWGDAKARPPFEVLHMGEPGRNWCGRENKAKLKEYMSKRDYNEPKETRYNHEYL